MDVGLGEFWPFIQDFFSHSSQEKILDGTSESEYTQQSRYYSVYIALKLTHLNKSVTFIAANILGEMYSQHWLNIYDK